jgi:hypothetical protein
MIIQIFELKCDDCGERFEDLHIMPEETPAGVRREARKRGWVRRMKETMYSEAGKDYCPQCKGNH